MDGALQYSIRSASLDAAIAHRCARRHARDAGMTLASTEIDSALRSPTVEPAIIRAAATGVIAVNAALPLIEVWRIGIGGGLPVLRGASIATIVTIALHLRHVTSALRNERPASNPWTLGSLAIVNVAALALVGRIWEMQLATLAVSILIALDGLYALALVSLVVFAPVILAWTPLGVGQPNNIVSYTVSLPPIQIVLYLGWRVVTLYVPIRLIAMIRQLDAARRSLESQAVIQARIRIEGELRSGLELALQRIVARGEVAFVGATRDADAASAELSALVADSRRALADARRIAAGYRLGSLRAEIDAAVSLLRAAGTSCRLIIAQDVVLEAAGVGSSSAIRAAVIRALDDGEHVADYVMHVRLDDGCLSAVVTPDLQDAGETAS